MKLSRILACSLLAIGLAGCGEQPVEEKRTREAKGGVVYGDVFRVNEVEDFRSLYPLNITEATAHRITNQIYEGLVKFRQKDLEIVPALAEKWEFNEEANSVIFSLRKGVKFHDDACFADGKGREVTAHDFQYCFTQLCSYGAENQMFFLFRDRVVGANEYWESTRAGNPMESGVSGIQVIDDYTLKIDLITPFGGFLNILGQPGCWVFPKEAVKKYGQDMRINTVGTGPFKMLTLKENEAVILERNEEYWRKDDFGNQLPYLDRIKFTFEKEKKTELLKFQDGELDMVFTLPLELIDLVMKDLDEAKKGGNKDHEMQITTAMGVQYFGFQHKLEPFRDVRVRRAFNYAIDRESIVDHVLRGEGQPAMYGIVPPAFKNYHHDSIRGFDFDPDKARELLAEAGYKDGKGFPELTLQINRGGNNNVQIAEVVQNMLQENLGVNVKLEELTTAQYLDQTESGQAEFWREAWIADYPDPETFLNLLVGKHVPAELGTKAYVNSVRYQSAEFDSIFNMAMTETDRKERYRLYRMADQIALNDAAIMPIYYEEFTRLLQPNVRNFPANAMEYRDFSEVYFRAPIEESPVPDPEPSADQISALH